MYDRTGIVEQKFYDFLNENNQRELAHRNSSLHNSDLSDAELIDVFESQIISRLLDIKSRSLKKLGKSFYTISSSGHEGLAIVGLISRIDDIAFLHYRDCAFFIQRSKKRLGHTIINDMLQSFCAYCSDPISGGRHKVLGSKFLNVPPQTSTIASHLPKALGAALSIDRRKQLGTKGELPIDAVSICSFGDASLNHASAQAALNCANWISYQNIPLPIIFICEDNHIGISVKTPIDWVRNSQSIKHSIKYFECNGLDLIESYEVTKKAFDYTRTYRKPCFLRFKTVRLFGHAGSDIETTYHSLQHITEQEQNDPLVYSANVVLSNHLMTSSKIKQMYDGLKQRIDRVSFDILESETLSNANQVMKPIVPFKKIRVSPKDVDKEKRIETFGNDWSLLETMLLPMNKLINMGLTDIMLQYDNTLLFGEDVARKGGVYNITSKLESRFSNKRVFDSLLDETSILGAAIGLAHNGFVPIPEIQFLAYIHNAQDQLRGEAATLSFFSNGQYTNGMVIRVAGLAYQKGFGGHFHNDNSLSIFRDIPGIVVACPSNGADAVRMLRTCVKEAHEYGKIFVFIEPIAIYPTRDLYEVGDSLWCNKYPMDTSDMIPVGEFFVDGESSELCILTYGNGFYLSKQAKKELEEIHHVQVKLIDLRWITSFNEKVLCEILSQVKSVLIVDECRKSGSLSEALVTMIIEKCSTIPKVARICGKDSYIPLGNADQFVLIQKKDIVEESLKLLRRVR